MESKNCGHNFRIFIWCEKTQRIGKINNIIKKYNSNFTTKLNNEKKKNDQLMI